MSINQKNQQQAQDMLAPHKRLCNVNSSTDNPPLFFYYNENYKIIVIKIQFYQAKSWGRLLNVTKYGRQSFLIRYRLQKVRRESIAVPQGLGWLFRNAFIETLFIKKVTKLISETWRQTLARVTRLIVSNYRCDSTIEKLQNWKLDLDQFLLTCQMVYLDCSELCSFGCKRNILQFVKSNKQWTNLALARVWYWILVSNYL